VGLGSSMGSIKENRSRCYASELLSKTLKESSGT